MYLFCLQLFIALKIYGWSECNYLVWLLPWYVVPKSNIAIIWMPIFEWCMVGCESKERNQNDMCSKETGLSVQMMLTILGFIVNMIGAVDLYVHKNLHFDIE